VTHWGSEDSASRFRHHRQRQLAATPQSGLRGEPATMPLCSGIRTIRTTRPFSRSFFFTIRSHRRTGLSRCVHSRVVTPRGNAPRWVSAKLSAKLEVAAMGVCEVAGYLRSWKLYAVTTRRSGRSRSALARVETPLGKAPRWVSAK